MEYVLQYRHAFRGNHHVCRSERATDFPFLSNFVLDLRVPGAGFAEYFFFVVL